MLSYKKITNHVKPIIVSSTDIIIFFHQRKATFVLSRSKYADFILINKFFIVFKGWFNKHCCNFDDVSKIGYSRSS